MKSRYTQDVEFNSAFGALQTPVHLFTAATLRGFRAPAINQPFRYLDVACGNGLTLALLADAYPFAEFVGIDINADHIARARQTAAKAGLDNISFIQADIADLKASEFADPFDYCALAGVYSWLDESRRRKTREFIASAVKPGGLTVLEYSVQPGMSQNATLYRILQQLGENLPGNSAEKLKVASHLLGEMDKKGAHFFESNQGARKRLESIMDARPEDEAHEVFNLEGYGLWSSEVIQSMAAIGICYLGSSVLHHNIDALALDSGLPKQSRDMPLHLQQMLKDILWNVAQRKDIYVNSEQPEKIDVLDTLKDFSVYSAPGALSERNRRGVSNAFPGIDFFSPAANTVVESLATASTFGEIAEQLASRGHSKDESTETILQLLGTTLISIAIEPLEAIADVDSVVMPSKLNRLILTEDIHMENGRPLTSPVVGSRVLLPIKDRLYLWAIINGDVGDAWDAMGDLRGIFQGDSGESLSREAFVKVIETSMANFKKSAVPELIRLGILAPSK